MTTISLISLTPCHFLVMTSYLIAPQIHVLTDRLKGLATNKAEEEEEEEEKVSRFQEAMSNLSDALLPVRGHGLIELTKLLDEADPETVSNAAKVVDALRENLEDDDTYIYLQARLGHF